MVILGMARVIQQYALLFVLALGSIGALTAFAAKKLAGAVKSVVGIAPALLLVFAAIVAVSGCAEENYESVFPAPFGLEWGMSRQDLKDNDIPLKHLKSQEFFTSYAVPRLLKNLSGASFYIVYFNNDDRLIAVGYVGENTASPWQAQNLYSHLKEDITALYGDPDSKEVNSPARLNPRDSGNPFTYSFFQCLYFQGAGAYAEERYGDCQWRSRWGSDLLADDWWNIDLELRSTGPKRGSEGYVVLFYKSPLWYKSMMAVEDSEALK